jgi:hypothetical protein
MRTRVLSLLLLALPAVSTAQSTTTWAGPPLFVLDVQGTPLDEFPNGVKALNGVMSTVDKNGQRMLKASSPSEFLITLPQVLPAAFTVIVDLIPKGCCAPDDFMLEGTPTMNRGVASVQLTWHPERISAVGGGGEMYQSAMPDDLAASTPGNLTRLVFEFNGSTIKLYTDGRRLYTLDKQFARGRVLRVWLGGADDGLNAMHLASFSVLSGAVAPAVIAGLPGAPGGNPTPPPGVPSVNQPTNRLPVVPPPQPQTASNSQSLSGGPVPTFVASVTVTQGSAGPVVSWLAVAAPATYTVKRWKIDDQSCCNNNSANLTGPPWQDVQPPLAGTYVYQVTVTTNGGTATGQAQFVNFKQGGQIASTGLAPTPSPGPRTITPTSPTPVVTAPTAAASGTVPSGFTVTVTMGQQGPVVSWPTVRNATGYMVTRSKSDDLNCCNAVSGRNWAATSPWQDGQLPMPGTYVYTVLANTPFGQMQAQTQYTLAAPVTAVLAAPTTTGTITPMPASSTPVVPAPAGATTTPVLSTRPAPAGATNAPSVNGPVPADLGVEGTPVVARLTWDVNFPLNQQPTASRYEVQRTKAGTTSWITLYRDPNFPLSPTQTDYFPDPRITYTYRVIAYQPDGSSGFATVDYTPPTPTDPSTFTATQTGPGEVRFEWTHVPGVENYLIAGPGMAAGFMAVGSHNTLDQKNSYTQSGVPAGTHTWTIASAWQPGGILTPSGSWPKATATVTVAATSARYRLVALGFKAEAQSRDIDDAHDGHGDEVYFAAIVNRTKFTGIPLPVTLGANLSMVLSRSHGDEAVAVPYGRIKAGTASATGGIKSGDLVPASLDLAAPTGTVQSIQFPLLIWEGDLDDEAVVVVHPILFEDDVNPIVQAIWAKAIFQAAPSGYVDEPPEETNGISTGFISHSTADRIYRLRDITRAFRPIEAIFNPEDTGLGNGLFDCTTIAVNLIRRPCEAHGVDRPIGLNGPGTPAPWRERIVVLTKSAIEKALTDRTTNPEWTPGTFMVPLKDCADYSCATDKTEAIANYLLYLRVERIP